MMKKEEETLQETDWKARWLSYGLANQRKILAGVVGALLIGALLIVYSTQDGQCKAALQARVAFEEWKKTPGDKQLTQDMERALKRAPNLRRVLEAEIAQVFLFEGQPEDADAMAVPCIERLKLDSPSHAAFAKASLWIEHKEYQKALEMSVSLKEELESSGQFVNLRGWNLLRIAFLQKQLRNSSGEMAAWEEVKSFLQREKLSAGKFLESGLGRSDFSLADFISHRERELTDL